MKSTLPIVLLACCGAAGLRADFTYEQSFAITGGKVAGAYINAAQLQPSKLPLEYETTVVSSSGNGVTETMTGSRPRVPVQKNTVMVRGNRKVTLSRDHAKIVDIDKETITDINFQKKTYSVITFQEMAEAKRELSATKKVTASIKDGGQSKTIHGLNAKLLMSTLEIETTDPKSDQKSTTVTTTEIWLAPSVPGYDEVRDFEQRMAGKVGGGSVGTTAGSGEGAGFQGGDAEVAKLDGVPVLQVIRMEKKGKPDAKAKRGHTAVNDVLDLEATLETTSFSQTADSSKFEVPADFNQVPPEITRPRKRK